MLGLGKCHMVDDFLSIRTPYAAVSRSGICVIRSQFTLRNQTNLKAGDARIDTPNKITDKKTSIYR